MKVSPEDHNAKNALTLGGLSARQLLFSVVFVFLKGWCESFFSLSFFFSLSKPKEWNVWSLSV